MDLHKKMDFEFIATTEFSVTYCRTYKLSLFYTPRPASK